MDNLTRLRNSESFELALETEISRARRYEGPLTLVGLAFQLQGEAALESFYPFLKMVASRVRHSIRELDIAARVGNQIWIIVPETGREGAHIMAGKLRTEIEALARENTTLGPLGVEIALAVVAYPEDGDDRKALMASLRTHMAEPSAHEDASPSEDSGEAEVIVVEGED